MPSCARAAQDVEGFLDRCENRVLRRIPQPRDEQRVDPLAVGGSPDPTQVLGADMAEQQRFHLRHARQVAVMRQAPGFALELERMHVLQRNLHRGGVGDAAHVRQHARRPDLLGEVLEVAIKHRQRGRAVGEWPLRRVRSGRPRAQAEAGEVQQVQHLRHVTLPDERRVGLEQQVVQQHRLAEIEQRAAHGLPHVAGRD